MISHLNYCKCISRKDIKNVPNIWIDKLLYRFIIEQIKENEKPGIENIIIKYAESSTVYNYNKEFDVNDDPYVVLKQRNNVNIPVYDISYVFDNIYHNTIHVEVSEYNSYLRKLKLEKIIK